ncbi:MAG: class I SAM-dependent methyltransferase [Proteobacteria bacterium]|nr:class I SAM-dependent methyltransferase [Pseudomonadota bacterium]
MSSTRRHWEDVYKRKPVTDSSWYQPHLDRSLAWIEALARPADALIDIGGGASTLVDDLLLRGFQDVTVLDVSGAALTVAKDRLGENARKVCWLEADIVDWQPPKVYRTWHDRAVFHFLTTPEHQEAYLEALHAGTEPGSLAIVATFALDGPEKCSGLKVQRYSTETLAQRFGAAFELIDQGQESHRTPRAAEQRFSFVALRRLR